MSQLEKGPMEQEKPKLEPLAPPDKPYEEMNQKELMERVKLERDYNLRLNGIQPEDVDKWKKEYGRVGSMTIGETLYIYRPVTRGEVRKLTEMAYTHDQAWRKELDFAEEIACRCTLRPALNLTAARNELPAGIIDSLSEAIQKLSGYGATVTVLEL